MLRLDRVLDEFERHGADELVDDEGRDFRHQVRTAAKELRDRTLAAVEAVLDWRRAVESLEELGPREEGAPPPPFLWEGQNFLVRLAGADDVEQLLASTPKFRRVIAEDFGCAFEVVPSARNLLLTECDLDDLADERDDGSLPADAGPAVDRERTARTWARLERLRCRRCARAVLAEERASRAAALRDAIGTPASSVCETRAADPTRLVLSESEQKRLRPPTVDPTELEALGRDTKPALPIVACFTCLHLVLQPEVIATNGRGLPEVRRPRRRRRRDGPRISSEFRERFGRVPRIGPNRPRS